MSTGILESVETYDHDTADRIREINTRLYLRGQLSSRFNGQPCPFPTNFPAAAWAIPGARESYLNGYGDR